MSVTLPWSTKNTEADLKAQIVGPFSKEQTFVGQIASLYERVVGIGWVLSETMK